MEKKTLILHIGQSKTGTSSIQKFCQAHSRELAEQGILYPSVKKDGIETHLIERNAFAESLCGTKRYPYLSFEDYVEQFDRQAKDFSGNTLLLSAESFWGMPHIWDLASETSFLPANGEKLEKLHGWTKNYRVKIILYLRHPLDWFRSAVSHIIRHEGLLAKKIYESDAQLYDLLKPHMDYLPILKLWEEVLNPFEISAKVFDKNYLAGNDSITDFCKLIGYTGPVTEDISENSSWPAEITMLKIELNEKRRSKWEERTIIRILGDIAKKSGFAQTYEIDRALQQRIIDDFEQQRPALAKEYGVQFPETTIRDIPAIDAIKIDSARQEFARQMRSPSAWIKIALQAAKGNARQNFTLPYNMLKTMVNRTRKYS